MCGICGIVTPGGPSRQAVGLMSDAIRHRGPDDDGFYSDDFATLGHRRLSIIDLGGGHQPITNEDGSLWIVFNGEIYNYRELRDRLSRAIASRPAVTPRSFAPLRGAPGEVSRGAARHVRVRYLGHPRALPVPGPRPSGTEAALLRSSG
jgi:glutamine phosphoribosylpyrophosphate amidotransferase